MKKIFKYIVVLFFISLSITGNSFAVNSNLRQEERVELIKNLKKQIEVLKNRIIFIIEKNVQNNFNNPKNISQYEITNRGLYLSESEQYLVTRSFSENGVKKVLAVNVQTLETKVFKKDILKFIKASDIFEGSKYQKVLEKLENKNNNSQNKIQNTGLQEAQNKKTENGKKEIFLTADFCPSRKSTFEKKFFEDFIKKGHRNVAIAITDSWVEKHKDGFLWLLQKQATGKLNITWVNHSHNHDYDFSEKSLGKNFLLIKNTNIEKEILEVEKMLLSYRQKPSVFMRFPGLVSDYGLRKTILEKYKLIFIGSNAWLAKGQSTQAGSIILIHGNKNEPQGVVKAGKLLGQIERKEKNFYFGNILDIVE